MGLDACLGKKQLNYQVYFTATTNPSPIATAWTISQRDTYVIYGAVVPQQVKSPCSGLWVWRRNEAGNVACYHLRSYPAEENGWR